MDSGGNNLDLDGTFVESLHQLLMDGTLGSRHTLASLNPGHEWYLKAGDGRHRRVPSL